MHTASNARKMKHAENIVMLRQMYDDTMFMRCDSCSPTQTDYTDDECNMHGLSDGDSDAKELLFTLFEHIWLPMAVLAHVACTSAPRARPATIYREWNEVYERE